MSFLHYSHTAKQKRARTTGLQGSKEREVKNMGENRASWKGVQASAKERVEIPTGLKIETGEVLRNWERRRQRRGLDRKDQSRGKELTKVVRRKGKEVFYGS